MRVTLHSLVRYWALSVLAFLTACNGGTAYELLNTSGGNPQVPADTSNPPATPAGGTGSTPAQDSGLPCPIAQLLQAHCQQCHRSPPVTAPMPLVTYSDLVAPSQSDPTRSYAQVALARMQDPVRPMPPAPLPLVSASEIASMQSWISAGMPQGSCSTATDGGTPLPNPYDTPTVCTSGTYWTSGTGSLMHPGWACGSCHTFQIAGTVYPTAHEPNDCNGAQTGSVVITDARGVSVSLTPNAAGNFLYAGGLTLPIRAKVVSSRGERAMAATQSTGNCNSCHTVAGANGAPGRIMLP